MKKRLDILLLDRGLATSRQKAQAIIMSGIVYVDGQKEDKSGSTFDDGCDIQIRGNTMRYVSRGGLKLERAIDVFGIELEGRVCMDVGASTGGFTDCMLQNGATKVYAIDVGHGQLDWKLRNDPRVICMEKTNIRYVQPSDIADVPHMCSIDVSFISLSKVLPTVRNILADDGFVVALIKPQFEAGREKVGKHGVVRDMNVHVDVIESAYAYAFANGFTVDGLTYSPIKGPEGNIEYLYLLRKSSIDKREADKKAIEEENIDIKNEDAITNEKNSYTTDNTIDNNLSDMIDLKYIKKQVHEAHEKLNGDSTI